MGGIATTNVTEKLSNIEGMVGELGKKRTLEESRPNTAEREQDARAKGMRVESGRALSPGADGSSSGSAGSSAPPGPAVTDPVPAGASHWQTVDIGLQQSAHQKGSSLLMNSG